MPTDGDDPLGALEHAFELTTASEKVIGKIREAVANGVLTRERPDRLVSQALEHGVIDAEQAALIKGSGAT